MKIVNAKAMRAESKKTVFGKEAYVYKEIEQIERRIISTAAKQETRIVYPFSCFPNDFSAREREYCFNKVMEILTKEGYEILILNDDKKYHCYFKIAIEW